MARDRTSPFVTRLINPGDSLSFTVKGSIFANAALRSRGIINGVGISRNLEESITLEIATGSFVSALVFNDRDHDGARDAREEEWPGVTVTLSDAGGPIIRQPDGGGGLYLPCTTSITVFTTESISFSVSLG